MAKIKLAGRKVCVRARKVLPCCGKSSDPCCNIPGQVGFFPLVGNDRPVTNSLAVTVAQTVSGWNYNNAFGNGKTVAPTVTATATLSSTRTIAGGSGCSLSTTTSQTVSQGASWQSGTPLAGQTIVAGSVALSGASDLGQFPPNGVTGVFYPSGGEVDALAFCDYRETAQGSPGTPLYSSPTFNASKVIGRLTINVPLLVGYYGTVGQTSTFFPGNNYAVNVQVDSAGGFAAFADSTDTSSNGYGPISGTASVSNVGPGNFTVHVDLSQPGTTRGNGVVVPAQRLVIDATMTSNMASCLAPPPPPPPDDFPIKGFIDLLKKP